MRTYCSYLFLFCKPFLDARIQTAGRLVQSRQDGGPWCNKQPSNRPLSTGSCPICFDQPTAKLPGSCKNLSHGSRPTAADHPFRPPRDALATSPAIIRSRAAPIGTGIRDAQNSRPSRRTTETGIPSKPGVGQSRFGSFRHRPRRQSAGGRTQRGPGETRCNAQQQELFRTAWRPVDSSRRPFFFCFWRSILPVRLAGWQVDAVEDGRDLRRGAGRASAVLEGGPAQTASRASATETGCLIFFFKRDQLPCRFRPRAVPATVCC